MPIKDGEGNVLAVAQVMNKQHLQQQPEEVKEGENETAYPVFTARDVSLFRAYTNFCGIGLHHAKILFGSQLETRRSQVGYYSLVQCEPSTIAVSF